MLVNAADTTNAAETAPPRTSKRPAKKAAATPKAPPPKAPPKAKTASKAASKPARSPRVSADARPWPHAPVFGTPPSGTSHFSVQALVGSKWTPIGYPAADGLELREWPLAELSLKTIRERWGDGTYVAHWLGFRDGRRVSLGRTKTIRLTTPGAGVDRVVHMQPAAPAPHNFGLAAILGSDPINAVVQLMGVAQKQADSQITQVRENGARALEQERSVFELLLKQQAAGFAQMQQMQAAQNEQQMTRLEERLEEIAARDDAAGDDDDDDDSGADVPPATPDDPFWYRVAKEILPAIGPQIAPGLNDLLSGIGALLKQRSALPAKLGN